MRKLLFFLCVPFLLFGQWYDTAWKSRVKITAQSSKVIANVDSFAVYYDLSNMPASFFSKVQSDGGDIVVTSSDGITKVPRYLVFVNTSGSTGHLEFRSTLSATANTVYYIYYNNAAATETNDATTYNQTYVAAWHFSDLPGTADTLIDATANDNGGTVVNAMVDGDRVDGVAGHAWNFNGTNQYVTIVASNSMKQTVDMTLYYIFRTTDANGTIIDDLGGAVFTSYSQWIVSTLMSWFSGAGWQSATGGVNSGAWMQMAASKSGTSLSYYKNGAFNVTRTVASPLTATNDLKAIAARSDGGASFYAGDIDEIRFLSVAVDSAWQATTYNMFAANSTFWVTGAEEQGSTATKPGYQGFTAWQRFKTY